MRNLTDKIYQDRRIFCKGDCNRVIGETRLDGQILILESGLIAFNYFAWQCLCGRNGSWSAPLLPNEAETLDALHPDTIELQNRAKKISCGVTKKKLASVGVTKMHDKYRARANVGGKMKYLGLYDSEAKARDAVLRAKSST
jgi:hypothetical protein